MLDHVSASVLTGLTNKRTIWPLSKMFIQSEYAGDSEEKIPDLPTGVEPMTYWSVIHMPYHWATGDSWELRPLNQDHVTIILHTATTGISICADTQWLKCDGEF